mmetsp:Transcript_20709/g.70142  ORF Transcript_20709/g.70142 Transcript_20709/m.70142 type:complete len:259 (+) Transcript_20709:337-1113(+)
MARLRRGPRRIARLRKTLKCSYRQRLRRTPDPASSDAPSPAPDRAAPPRPSSPRTRRARPRIGRALLRPVVSRRSKRRRRNTRPNRPTRPPATFARCPCRLRRLGSRRGSLFGSKRSARRGLGRPPSSAAASSVAALATRAPRIEPRTWAFGASALARAWVAPASRAGKTSAVRAWRRRAAARAWARPPRRRRMALLPKAAERRRTAEPLRRTVAAEPRPRPQTPPPTPSACRGATAARRRRLPSRRPSRRPSTINGW